MIFSIVCIVGAIVLRVFDKIPADALIPTILALSGVGATLIAAIAWEDTRSGRVRPSASEASAKSDA